MTFEIEVGGNSRSVVVEPEREGRYRITIDGHVHVVDAWRVGEFGLSILNTDGASREIQVVPSAVRGEVLVSLEGRSIAATVDGRRFRRSGTDSGTRGHGAQNIVAPMPGRVVRVLVGVGDEIAARQPVAVVEAMKMENELRSPKAGRVKDVTVEPGASVEAGRVLVVVE